MPRGHAGIPAKRVTQLSKAKLLAELQIIDNDPAARARVLAMETDFKHRITGFVAGLPLANAKFDRFRTSPYVLLFHSAMHRYTNVSQIEHDILPAKLFSSMETSAGKMIELVTLPVYGWETVPSKMHSVYSALDGRKVSGSVLTVATLKSGPACLNDEMAENFADTILSHAPTWAGEAGVSEVEFTYGVLYGTTAQSNKKDWHILRNLYDKVGAHAFTQSPTNSWTTSFVHRNVSIEATIRIGTDWWTYLGGSFSTAVEVWSALIRACIAVGPGDPVGHEYVISDLSSIVNGVPRDYNVSLLQAGQLQWLFFIARHFADQLLP